MPKREKPTPPAEVPALKPRHQFNPSDAGFSLLADEQTLVEIENTQDEAVKAAQETLKFAWR